MNVSAKVIPPAVARRISLRLVQKVGSPETSSASIGGNWESEVTFRCPRKLVTLGYSDASPEVRLWVHTIAR